MENKILGKVILAAVLFIFGAVMVSIVADAEQVKTTKTAIVSEAIALDLGGYPLINATKTYTVANPPTSDNWKGADCPLTEFAIKNQSGTALTITDDYTVNLATGTYLLVDNTDTNTSLGLYGKYNNTYVDYKYCSDEYINSSWGRSTLDMVAGFLAILVFGAAVGILYSVYKDFQ